MVGFRRSRSGGGFTVGNFLKRSGGFDGKYARGFFGRCFYQRPHPGMAGDNVRRNAFRIQGIVHNRADRAHHQPMFERGPNVGFETHLAGNQKQVIELHRRGEKHHIAAVARYACNNVAKWAKVIRQFPTVEGNWSHAAHRAVEEQNEERC